MTYTTLTMNLHQQTQIGTLLLLLFLFKNDIGGYDGDA